MSRPEWRKWICMRHYMPGLGVILISPSSDIEEVRREVLNVKPKSTLRGLVQTDRINSGVQRAVQKLKDIIDQFVVRTELHWRSWLDSRWLKLVGSINIETKIEVQLLQCVSRRITDRDSGFGDLRRSKSPCGHSAGERVEQHHTGSVHS